MSAAMKAKLEREAHLKELQKEKMLLEYEEFKRKKDEEEKASARRMQIIGIIEAILFGGMLALHVVLSVIQRDYTGVNVAIDNFCTQLNGGSSIFTVLSISLLTI